MLNPESLAATLDAVNEARFHERKIPQRERGAIAGWLAHQCGQKGSYEGMPAPTPQDFASAPRLYTGEPLAGRGGTACKLGNEGCRALILLEVKTAAVTKALGTAEERMTARLDPPGSRRAGFYCCGSCTVALWRHLLAGGLDQQEERLANGMTLLRQARLDSGGWRFFPSWYTIWTLLEVEGAAARTELQYAAPRMERYLKRPPRMNEPYATRRGEIARRALERV